MDETSKFKHVYGTCHKKSDTYYNIKSVGNVKCNSSFLVYSVGDNGLQVLPIQNKGKLNLSEPNIRTQSLSFEVSPIQDELVASG